MVTTKKEIAEEERITVTSSLHMYPTCLIEAVISYSYSQTQSFIFFLMLHNKEDGEIVEEEEK
jgi:hypothetical protein